MHTSTYIGRSLFGVLLLIASFNLRSQSNSVQTVRDTIIGVLQGTDGRALAGGTLILLSRQDSAFLTYALSNENGQFQLLSRLDRSEVFIKASSIGYRSNFFPVDSKEPLLLELVGGSTDLQQITVREKVPIRTRGDTLLYRGDAFRDSTEQKAADLLRKLPGFEVSETGDIKVNGTPIRTLLIDGDNLLEDSYQVVTNNLGAATIQDVEVINGYSQNPLLSEFIDGQEIAVNFITSEDIKNQLNGELEFAAGSRNRRSGAASAIGLFGKFKTVNFLNAANTGRPLANHSRNTVASSSLSQRTLLAPIGPELSGLSRGTEQEDPTRIRSNRQLTGVGNYRMSKGWKVTTNLIVPAEDFERKVTNVYDYADGNLETRNTQQTSSLSLMTGGLTVENTVSGKSYLKIQARLFDGHRNNHTRYRPAETFGADAGAKSVGVRAELSRKMGERTLGILSAFYQKNTEANDLTIVDTIDQVINPNLRVARDTLRQTTHYRTETAGASVSYLHYRNKLKLVSTAGLHHRTAQFSQLGETNQPVLLSRFTPYLNGTASVNLNPGLTLDLVTGTGVLVSRQPRQSQQETPYLTFEGSITQRWSAQRESRFVYQSRVTTPAELQTVPIYRYRSRYRTEQGSAELLGLTARSQLVSVSHESGKAFPFRYVSVQGSYSRKQLLVTETVELIRNTSLITYENRPQTTEGFDLVTRWEKMLAALSLTTKLSVAAAGRWSDILFEGGIRSLNARTLSGEASVRTGFDLPVNMIIGVISRRTSSLLTGNDEQTRFNATQWFPYLDLAGRANRFSGTLSINWQHLITETGTSTNSLADFRIDYKPKQSAFGFGLLVANLFNTNGVSASQNFGYAQFAQLAEVLPRYVLLRTSYSW